MTDKKYVLKDNFIIKDDLYFDINKDDDLLNMLTLLNDIEYQNKIVSEKILKLIDENNQLTDNILFLEEKINKKNSTIQKIKKEANYWRNEYLKIFSVCRGVKDNDKNTTKLQELLNRRSDNDD